MRLFTLIILPLFQAIQCLVTLVVMDPGKTINSKKTPPPPHIQKAIRKFSRFYAIFYLAMLYFFSQGHEWARWVMIALCCLSAVNALLSFQVDSKWLKAYLIWDVFFSAFLLYWLTRPQVADLFKR